MRIGLLAAALLVAAGCEGPAKRMTVPRGGGLSYSVYLQEEAYDAETNHLRVPLTISVGSVQSSAVLIDTEIYTRATLADSEAPAPALRVYTGPDLTEPVGGTFAHSEQIYRALTWSLPTGCMAPSMDLGANRLAMTLEIAMPDGFKHGVTPIDVDVTVWRLEFLGPDEDGAWAPVRRFHTWGFRVDPNELEP